MKENTKNTFTGIFKNNHQMKKEMVKKLNTANCP